MEKKIESFGQLDFWLLPAGILEVRSAAGLEKNSPLTLAEAKKIEAVQAEYHRESGRSIRLLVRIDNMTNATKEVNAFWKTAESKLNDPDTSGIALLANNLMTKMLGAVSLAINRQEYPTKLFQSREKALKWLESLEER
ncbi:hypothetical protein SapgrDRAFT_2692 [Saprospira grandis DSM 2844]|uniref:DUF7793 domain-containing protein n=1 Tax=Saprospira grandis DSM 2844 TaxID=694433 RepID=J1I7E6_9BACT|nr:STAS/SEC14 domain-containing protein [Saprospira grandis]EJF54348.1 hypothetical protein SapgrDRAFT_2692 [Saprospira grandis DSM 2844]